MDRYGVQNWLNRTGLVLQFLALFLVTLEIFGEEKVRAATGKYLVNPLVRMVAYFRRHPILRGGGYAALAVLILVVYAAVHVGINGSLTVTLGGDSLAAEVIAVVVIAALPYLLWRLAKALSTLAARMIDGAATARRSFLPVGAFLFAVGFLALLAATFVRPS